MRTGLTLLLIFLTFNSFSQQVLNDFLRFYPKDSSAETGNYASFDFNYRFNSTGVTNAFYLDYTTGDFITESLKDQVSDRLNRKNRFGYELNTSISAFVEKDSATRIIAGLSARQIISSVFSKDLFNLFFRGNKMFAGETARLDPFKFNSVSYQSLYLGLSKELLPKKMKVWGGVSAVRGGNFREANAEMASLYTDPDGAFIEAKTDFNAGISDGSPGLIAKANGIGASVFLGADISKGRSTVGISVSDLGFIRWSGLKTYSANGTYRFEGKEIPNILSFSDTLFTSYNADSLAEEVGIEIKDKNKFYFLPTFFKLNYVFNYSKNIVFIAGLDYTVTSGYSPRVYLKPVYMVNDNFFLHTVLAYGGFGKADFELGVAGTIFNGFTGYINIFAAELIAAPGKTSGNGLSVALIKSF